MEGKRKDHSAYVRIFLFQVLQRHDCEYPPKPGRWIQVHLIHIDDSRYIFAKHARAVGWYYCLSGAFSNRQYVTPKNHDIYVEYENLYMEDVNKMRSGDETIEILLIKIS